MKKSSMKPRNKKNHKSIKEYSSIKYIDSVYLPREDSKLLKKYITKHLKKNKVMKSIEIGTGSGILADEISNYSKETYAIDINPKALEHAKNNTKNSNKIVFIKSDLFSNVGKEHYGSFDLIVFNPPYLPDHEKIRDYALDGGPEGWEVTKRFIDSFARYLSKDGKVILLFSSLTKKEKIDEFILNNCLKSEEISKEVMEDGEVLYVYEIRKSSILRSLEEHGVSDVYYLARGHRGIIYTGIYKSKKVSIKLKLEKSEVDTIKREINFLKILGKTNTFSFIPKLLFYEEDYFVYKYIRGLLIRDYLEKARDSDKKRFVLKMFSMMYKLDLVGISKEEMHHPWKHVFIRGDEIKMIDFERCHFDNNPKNVTQFCQFLTTEEVANLLNIKNRERVRESLILKLKSYKKSYSINSLLDIILEFYNDTDIKVYEMTAVLAKNELVSYKGIADRLNIKAYRHIGKILNMNPFAPFVPCHKVIEQSKVLGGFARGKKEKRRLLKKEGFDIIDGKLVNVIEDNGIFRRKKKVLAYGTFDLFHRGHEYFLKEAKKLGEDLVIVIALDEVVKKIKGKLPNESENERMNFIKKLDYVSKVYLGKNINLNLDDKFYFVKKLNPDIIVLGYDQNDMGLLEYIKKNRLKIEVARIKSFKPELYKSTIIKKLL